MAISAIPVEHGDTTPIPTDVVDLVDTSTSMNYTFTTSKTRTLGPSAPLAGQLHLRARAGDRHPEKSGRAGQHAI